MKNPVDLIKSCFGADASKDKELEEPSQPSEPEEPVTEEPDEEEDYDDTPTPEEAKQHQEIFKLRHSRPMQEAKNVMGTEEKHNLSYTVNWAGALLNSPPPKQRYKAAWGTFTVPKPNKGLGSASQWAAAAWVGIDGASYNKCILQAGCDFLIDANGKRSYSSWYEWYPAPSGSFDNFRPHPGNVVTIGIVAKSPKKGKVILKNHTTGHQVSKTLHAPNKNAHLGGQNAEWIVEDFIVGDSMIPLVNFKTVHWKDCHAKTGKRDRVGLDPANRIEMVTQDGSRVLTRTHFKDKHHFSIAYTA